MHLHYLVKLYIRVFVKILMLEKRTQEILLINFDFIYWKRWNFLSLMLRYGKFNQEIYTKLYLNRPRFVNDMRKTFWCVFRFTVLTAVHLQNANAKFHNRVETLFTCGGKGLHFCATKLLRTICTKFHHNRSGFVDCISKNILVCQP